MLKDETVIEKQRHKNDLNKRFVFITGSIFLIILMFLSLMYCRERTIFSDAAFYLFSMAEQSSPAIFHNRYMAIFSQLLPLLALKFSLPLSVVAKAYSISFVLLQLLVFFLIFFKEKESRFSLIVVLFSSLIITESFFSITSELTIGIFLLLFICSRVIVTNEIEQRKTSLYCLVPLLVFSHALLLFPLCFLLVFLHLQFPKQFLKKDIFRILGLFFLALVLKGLLLPDPYEHSAFSGLKNFYLQFPNYFTLPSNIEFYQRIVTHYYWIPILLTVNSIIYFKQKNWLKLFLVNGSVIFHIGFINICFPGLDTPLHYRDNLLSPIAIYLATPFVFDVYNKLTPIYIRAIILLVLFSGCFRLMQTSSYFHNRYLVLESIYQQFQNKKVIIKRTPKIEKQLIQTWASPYEFWLLSTIENNSSASIIITDSVSLMKTISDKNGHIFLNAWGPSEYKNFPKQYFKFTDTMSYYQVVSN